MNVITAEMLNDDCLKNSLTKYWKGYRERFGKDPEQHRHPDTVVGFLTKEKLHEMLTNPNHDMLLHVCGLALIDNDEVAFFADDGNYGYNTLSKNFGRCTVSGILYQYGKGQRYPDVDAIVATHFKGKRFLNSVEELVEYANGRRQ